MDETESLPILKSTQFKCKAHPTIPCDYISLDNDIPERTLCFNCAKDHSIPLSKLISISSILESPEDIVFNEYPPLNDNNLQTELAYMSLHQELEQIDSFFKKLREDIEKAIRDSQNKAKAAYIQFDKSNERILEECIGIAEIQKLKQILLSKEETAAIDLDLFINEKLNKAEQHREILQNLIDKLPIRFEQFFEEPNLIADEIITNIKNINFFFTDSKSFQGRLLKSTIGTSEKLEITKINRSTYEIKKNEVSLTYWDTVFIDPILNPSRKYIFQIELEMHHTSNNNQFFFGIIKDQRRDQPQPFKEEMSYYDYSNSFGITRFIKGKRMQSGSEKTGKHSFEMRIHINQRILKVASLPKYESILEIDNVNKIDPKGDYRVFVSMFDQGDIIRIKSMKVVNFFDEKM